MTRLDPKSAPYAALVNGVARNLTRRRDEFLASGTALDIDTPAWLAARWRKAYGEETAQAIAAANRLEPTLDISVKSDPAFWAEKLDAVLLPTGSVRLKTHAPVHDLPGYDEGAWWVQDAAAALPAQLLEVSPGFHVGDLCSAPGGKAAQLAARGARVTAVDRSAERLKILATNFQRLRLEAEVVVADVTTLSTPSCSMRPVPAPARSAAIPTSPGRKRPATSPSSRRCKRRCSTKPLNWSGRAAR